MALPENKDKKALGRGLASLIPDAGTSMQQKEGTTGGAPALTPKKEYFLCDIEKIVPNTYQPRKIFEKEALDELVESVKQVGIIQPITVRHKDGAYEIIAGERRWRAAQRAGFKQVPVIVKDVTDDVKSSLMALIENIQRADLNCIEEAIAYQQLVDEFQLSQEDVATRVGKNRATVANTMRLLKLPAVIREDIIAGKLTMGHARTLLSLESSADQLQVREQIIKRKLSVRDTERQVGEIIRGKNKPPTQEKAADPNLIALEDDLRREYGAPVRFVGNMTRGFVQISYSSQEELLRITDKLKGYQQYQEPVQQYVGEDGVTYQLSADGTQYVPVETPTEGENQVVTPESQPQSPEGNNVSPQV